MAYQNVDPPFSMKYDQMSKTELKACFEWFMSEQPKRLQMLMALIHETPSYSSWKMDFSADSLATLGEWYCSNVETQPRGEEEIAKIKSQLPFEHRAPLKIALPYTLRYRETMNRQ